MPQEVREEIIRELQNETSGHTVELKPTFEAVWAQRMTGETCLYVTYTFIAQDDSEVQEWGGPVPSEEVYAIYTEKLRKGEITNLKAHFVKDPSELARELT